MAWLETCLERNQKIRSQDAYGMIKYRSVFQNLPVIVVQCSAWKLWAIAKEKIRQALK